MSKTLYYSVEFVTLHQKKPTDLPSPSSSAPYLTIGTVVTGRSKYGLEVGYGDPGENPSFDFFDYPEFRISGIQFERPDNFSERGTFDREASGGGTSTGTYAKWGTTSVADDYELPLDFRFPLPGGWSEAATSWIKSAGIQWSTTGMALLGGITYNATGIQANWLSAFTAAGSWALVRAGVPDEIITAISNSQTVADALTDYYTDASATLDTLLRGFDSGMTPEQANQILDAFLNQSQATFVEAAEDLISGTSPLAGTVLTNLRISEQILLSPDGQRAERSTTGVQGVWPNSGHETYTGETWTLGGATPKMVDIVLDGMAGSTINTAESDEDAGGGADYVAAGGGNDSVTTGAGNDVVNAGSGDDTVDGGTGSDYIVGGGGVDRLAGSDGDDQLYGGDGADIIEGGMGADRLKGGAGSDILLFDLADVVLDGGDGFDTVRAPTNVGLNIRMENWISIEQFMAGGGNDSISGSIRADTILGRNGNDLIDGRAGRDTMSGGLGDDIYVIDDPYDVVIELAGQGNKDRFATHISTALRSDQSIEIMTVVSVASTVGIGMVGNNFAQAMTGNNGNNALNGGGGLDVLTGNGGKDAFFFTTALGAGNVDVITDFTVADDHFRLENAIFTALPTTGGLSADAFWKGTAAHDATDRIIYNAMTGALMYDADGNGAGAAIQFAKLTTGLALTNSHFLVI